jgi:hypothetical protein
MKTAALWIGSIAVVLVGVMGIVTGFALVWQGDWRGLAPLIGFAVAGLLIYGASDDF